MADIKKVSDVPAETLTWFLVEHRRQLIGGTRVKDYGEYPSFDDAESVREQLELDPEFGVSYSIEHRVK
jgi:hypothetical protein